MDSDILGLGLVAENMGRVLFFFLRASGLMNFRSTRDRSNSFTSYCKQPSKMSCMQSGERPFVTLKKRDEFGIESCVKPYVMATSCELDVFSNMLSLSCVSSSWLKFCC